MGNLPITAISIAEAEHLDNLDLDISLKLDGTLIYFKNNKLFSPRCERSERFKHILKILIDNNFPNCAGEIFIDEKGSCVFDVSKRENWAKAKIYVFDILDNPLPYSQRKVILDEKVKQLNNSFIVPVKRFKDFKEAWAYVVENNCEGVCIRNDRVWFKCKLLQNTKIEIVGHQVGKDKGCFILANGNRVSGTSLQIVGQYLDIKRRGKKAIAEISYPFITKEGHFFQPRLTNLVEVEK